jgi:hypothetical protein
MRRYVPSNAVGLAAIGVLATMFAGVAQAADPTVAVLGIEPVEVPEQLSQALTDALRQRAAATGGIKMVQGKDLVEMKMIFGCDGEAASCMAQAGRSLGADKLLYGVIKKAGKRDNQALVALKLLDVNSSNIERFVNETVFRRDLQPGTANALAARWFAALVEIEAKPTLNITSEPSGAAVVIDGQPAGRTPVTVRDLSAGPHTFVLSITGHVASTRSVELRPGGHHEVSIQLERESSRAQPQPVQPTQPPPEAIVAPPPPPPPPATSHPGRAAKGVAIGAFAAAVVAGAVAIYTWRTYRDLEDSAHNDLKGLSAMASPENKSFFDNPTCTPPATLSGPQVQTYKDHCSSGQTYADATTALWVTAGVLATAGVVSFIVGDRQSAKAKRETQPKTAGRLMQQSLRIAPVFSTQSGGLSASFEF